METNLVLMIFGDKSSEILYFRRIRKGKMAKDTVALETKMIGLLQNLLAIEMWRGGLSQAEIGKRLVLKRVGE